VTHQAVGRTGAMNSDLRPGKTEAEIAHELTHTKSGGVAERVIGVVLLVCGILSILTTVGIVFILAEEALKFFQEVSVIDFLTGTTWTALFQNPEFGVLPLVTATLLISILSMVIAIPVGLLCAIFLSEYAPPRVRAVLKPVMELLAGIPTIVYGFFALTFLTPDILKPLIPGTDVYNALAASIAVGIMIVPLVASLSEDALSAVPRAIREGAYGLGATKMEVSLQVVTPSALSGIIASFVLAISRAFGETMIVALAAGLRANMSIDPREGMETMTSYMVQVFTGDVVTGSTVYQSLFAVGFLLFLITLAMNIFSNFLVSKFREAYD
jgi:phosphate transport system permease protein